MIESAAYKTVEEMRGAADATATAIYAAAYTSTPEARSLYEFVKTMDTYEKIIGEGDTLVFSTRDDPFRFLVNALERTRRNSGAQRTAERQSSGVSQSPSPSDFATRP